MGRKVTGWLLILAGLGLLAAVAVFVILQGTAAVTTQSPPTQQAALPDPGIDSQLQNLDQLDKQGAVDDFNPSQLSNQAFGL